MIEYSVKLSVDARKQIDDIRKYIEVDLGSPQASRRFVEDTYDAVDRLTFFPFSHPIVEGSS